MTTIIRVGLIGLSGSSPSDYEGTNWASSAHLPYLTSTPHYKIVALLNRSVESAEAAIAKYKLPSSTKAYGDPEDLAKDPDIDLVVCSTRVDRHFQTVRPSIIAGKSVFVEWPLERNLNVAKEVTALAKEHNSKTIIGLQGSFSPLMIKLKQTIESGRIGKVLSSSQFAALGNMGGSEGRNVRYFLDREVGGNILSIHFGHTVEFVQFVLGNFKSFDSLLAIRRPTIDIVDRNADNKVLVKDAKNTVPDQILFHGTHEPSNAVTTLHLTGGQRFPGTPSIEWRIRGESGEIRITSPSWSLGVGNPEAKAELFEYGKEGNENVKLLVPDRDEFDELPTAAQNIARLYEAYWKGEWHPDFEWAVKRHELLEEMWRCFDETSG